MKKPKPTRRALTAHERELTLMLTMATHFTIRLLDELKTTNLYSQRLKARANSFEQELMHHADATLWEPATIEDSEGTQLEFLIDRMRELTLLNLGTSHVPDSLRPLYSAEMNKLFKRFGMNLHYGPSGELRVVPAGKETLDPKPQPGPSVDGAWIDERLDDEEKQKMKKHTLIIGQRGVGKSSIASVVAGEYGPDEVVYIYGRDPRLFNSPFAFSGCSKKTKAIVVDGIANNCQAEELLMMVLEGVTVNKRGLEPFVIDARLIMVCDFESLRLWPYLLKKTEVIYCDFDPQAPKAAEL